MADQKPARTREAANVILVAVYVIASWIALAAAIDGGALIAVMLFDRFYSVALAVTSAEQAWWVWAGSLGFGLLCYAAGVYRAATWFAIVPEINEKRRNTIGRSARVGPQPHEIQKTGPSAEEIRLRGMPRGQ